MKNKGWILTGIVLLSVAVLLLTGLLVVFLNGNLRIWQGIWISGGKSDTMVLDKTFKAEGLESITIRHDAGDIVFRESSDGKIRVQLYGEKEDMVEVTAEGNSLTVDDTRRAKNNWFRFGRVQQDLIVSLPADYENEIVIDQDYGECRLCDLEQASVRIDCDAGNVVLGKIRTAEVQCDLGNIEIREVLNRCRLIADCGNVEVDRLSLAEDSSIRVDLGNVEIGSTNEIAVDATVSLGNREIRPNPSNAAATLTIACDCGNVTVRAQDQ